MANRAQLGVNHGDTSSALELQQAAVPYEWALLGILGGLFPIYGDFLMSLNEAFTVLG